MTDRTLTADEINTSVKLDFDQRARAVRLEDVVNDDPYAAAAEIIFLRDEIDRLRTANAIWEQTEMRPKP